MENETDSIDQRRLEGARLPGTVMATRPGQAGANAGVVRRTGNPVSSWCFTWNNPDLSAQQFADVVRTTWRSSYVCYQAERGHENNVRHFQGYAEWPSSLRKRLGGVRKLLPLAHWEPRLGSRDQARDYAMKSDTREPGTEPIEIGVWQTVTAGRRTDLEAAVASLRTNGWNAMIQEHPTTFVRYNRGLEALAFELGQERTNPPSIYLYYGPTGCGKSRMAFDLAPRDERWIAPVGSQGGWFNGYHGQPLAILDDFAGRMTGYRLDDCLRLFDRYEVSVPVKGGFTQWFPDVIVITTNIHPSRWWDYENRAEHFAALRRRFTLVYAWRRDGLRTILGQFSDGWERFWRGPVVQQPIELPRPGPLDDWVEHPPAPDDYNFWCS